MYINPHLLWHLDVTLFHYNQHVIFKRQPHKVVNLTQTIRRLLPTNSLSVFDHFVGLVLTELRKKLDKQ